MNLVLNSRPCLGVFIFTCLQFCDTHQCTVSIATHSKHKLFNEGEFIIMDLQRSFKQLIIMAQFIGDDAKKK